MQASDSSRIESILQILSEEPDPGVWWKGNPDRVMLGAVLTQQTRWEQVEQALEQLKEKGLLTLNAVHRADADGIEEAIRCTGFYRLKTRRLKALAALAEEIGGPEGMKEVPLPVLRTSLLGVPGIGEETADSILCFALGKQTFVLDRYTERICTCAGIGGDRRSLKRRLESLLPRENEAMRLVHARFVEYAKAYCGKKRCEECRIRRLNE